MKIFVATLIVIAILTAGLFFFLNREQQSKKNQPQPTIQSKDTRSSAQIHPGYSGALLAGKSAPFLEFTKVDYEKALSEGKIIILDFYANWCPICRAEEPALHAGFDGLASDKVIGFRVNYKDSETDQDEESLAKQFNITYQHTKVILKDGKEFSKSLDSWTKERFDEEISNALK